MTIIVTIQDSKGVKLGSDSLTLDMDQPVPRNLPDRVWCLTRNAATQGMTPPGKQETCE